MQKHVWQGRALLLIMWMFSYFFGFLALPARAGDYTEYPEEHIRIVQEDLYYHAQFNPDDDIRFQAVLLLKMEEDEWLIIQKALYDSSYYVRGAAVTKLNSSQYNNLLWEIFYKDDSLYVRQNAMYNLVKNIDMTEKDSLQKEFIEIILDEENEDPYAFYGLNEQTNQEFFYYLVDRYIVENDGYMTNSKCLSALSYINNSEEKIKLIEEIKNHFANLDEGTKNCLDRHYENALEELSRQPAAK